MAKLFGNFSIEEDDAVLENSEGLPVEEVVEFNDVVEEHNDLVEQAEVLEQAEVAVEHLEDIVAVKRSMISSGKGLNSTAAMGYNFAVETLCENLGLPFSQVSVSAESYSDDPLTATTLSCEAEEGIVQRTWAAIKEMARKIFDGIINFFKKLVVRVVPVQTKAKMLISKAKKLKEKGASASDTTINEPELNVRLYGETNVELLKLAATAGSNKLKDLLKFAEDYKIEHKTGLQKIYSWIGKIGKLEIGISTSSYKETVIIPGYTVEVNKFITGSSGKITGISIYKPKDDSDKAYIIKVRRVSLPNEEANKYREEGKKLNVLMLDEIISIGEEVVKGSEELRRDMDKASSSMRKMLSNFDNQLRSTKDLKESDKENAKFSRNVLVVLANLVPTCALDGMKNQLAVLSFCSKCVAVYKA